MRINRIEEIPLMESCPLQDGTGLVLVESEGTELRCSALAVKLADDLLQTFFERAELGGIDIIVEYADVVGC